MVSYDGIIPYHSRRKVEIPRAATVAAVSSWKNDRILHSIEQHRNPEHHTRTKAKITENILRCGSPSMISYRMYPCCSKKEVDLRYEASTR